MVKSQILNKLTELYPNLLRKDLEKALDTVFDKIIEELKKNNRVELRSFGIFWVKRRKSRKGINPKSGASIIVDEKNYVRFKMSHNLKKIINEYNIKKYAN